MAVEPLRIGLVGLGLMGRGMGLSLQRAGHHLGIVAHRRRETADELLRGGAWEARDAAALAERCDAIVTCLPSAEAVEQVLFGAGGIVRRTTRAPLLLVECSTLQPAMGVGFAQRLSAHGIAFADAPVTRGPREAEQGKLNALVGGAPELAQRARPVLQAFCEQQFELGPTGSGYAAKLVNNFLAFNNLVAIAEAMDTAARAGLAVPLLLQAIGVSGGQNRVLDGLAPWLSGTGPSRSLVTLDTAHKDARYYAAFAASLGSLGPVARTLEERLATAIGQGLGPRFTPELIAHAAARPFGGPQGSPT